MYVLNLNKFINLKRACNLSNKEAFFLGRFSILHKCQNYPCMKYQIGMRIALACMALEVGHVGKHI